MSDMPRSPHGRREPRLRTDLPGSVSVIKIERLPAKLGQALQSEARYFLLVEHFLDHVGLGPGDLEGDAAAARGVLVDFDGFARHGFFSLEVSNKASGVLSAATSRSWMNVMAARAASMY